MKKKKNGLMELEGLLEINAHWPHYKLEDDVIIPHEYR